MEVVKDPIKSLMRRVTAGKRTALYFTGSEELRTIPSSLETEMEAEPDIQV